MTDPGLDAHLADAVLVLHVGVVVFVVGGLVAIGVGRRAGWRWVDRRGFRLAHLAAVGFIVVQTWLGAACPLTTLEGWLRLRAHATPHAGSFIGHWLQRLLYIDAPPWVFVVAYSVFGAAVVASWWLCPPRRPR